jgi:hypothetical protein
MQRTAIGFMIAIVLAATGCAGFQELSIEQRNRNAAYCAWKRVRWEYQQQGVPYRIREHLGRGFQQGYYDVSMGGNGSVPLFPPNVYWGVKYQNEAGSAAIGAWFRGYQDGAIAAEKDGLASFNQIPSSWAPPAQPGDPSGALTRDEFDGDQEIVPAVPVVPPAAIPGPAMPMQTPPSELPPLLQPETPATPPAAALPVLPLPTPSNSPTPPVRAPDLTTPAPSTTPVPSATPPSPSGTSPAGSRTTAIPQPNGSTGTPALTVPMPTNPMPTATVPQPTGSNPAATVPPSAAPSATPAPTPAKTPRDPIGGRQTLFLPEASTTPSAQLSLFGQPAEPSAAVEVLR